MFSRRFEGDFATTEAERTLDARREKDLATDKKGEARTGKVFDTKEEARAALKDVSLYKGRIKKEAKALNEEVKKLRTPTIEGSDPVNNMKEISLKMIGVQDMMVRLAKDANLPANVTIGYETDKQGVQGTPKAQYDALKHRSAKIAQLADRLLGSFQGTELGRDIANLKEDVMQSQKISKEEISRTLPKVEGYTKDDIWNNVPVTEGRDQIIGKLGQPGFVNNLVARNGGSRLETSAAIDRADLDQLALQSVVEGTDKFLEKGTGGVSDLISAVNDKAGDNFKQLESRSTTGKVPTQVRKDHNAVENARTAILNETGIEPDYAEIADYVNESRKSDRHLSPERVENVIQEVEAARDQQADLTEEGESAIETTVRADEAAVSRSNISRVLPKSLIRSLRTEVRDILAKAPVGRLAETKQADQRKIQSRNNELNREARKKVLEAIKGNKLYDVMTPQQVSVMISDLIEADANFRNKIGLPPKINARGIYDKYFAPGVDNKATKQKKIRNAIAESIVSEMETAGRLGKQTTPSQESEFSIEEGSATRVTDTGAKATQQVNSHGQSSKVTKREIADAIRNTDFDNDWVQWSPGKLNPNSDKARRMPPSRVAELLKQPETISKFAAKKGLKLRPDAYNKGLYHIYKPGKPGSPNIEASVKEFNALSRANKEYIDNVTEQLKKAWPGIKIASTAEAYAKAVAGLGVPSSQIKGAYLVGDNTVVINPNLATYDTPIHEFGHIWAKQLMRSNPELWKRGVELLKGSEFMRAVDSIPTYQQYRKDGNLAKFYEEVMANAIGKHGANLFTQKSKQNAWNKWMRDFGNWIKSALGIQSKSPYGDLTLNDWLDTAVHGVFTGTTPTKPGVPNEVELSIVEKPQSPDQSYYTDKTVETAKLDGVKTEAKWWKPKGWIKNLVPPAADDYHGLIQKLKGIVPDADLEKVSDEFIKNHQAYARASTQVRDDVKAINKAFKAAGLKLDKKYNDAVVEGKKLTAAQAIQAAVNGQDNDFVKRPEVKKYMKALQDLGVLKPNDDYTIASPQADVVGFIINDLYAQKFENFVKAKDKVFTPDMMKEILGKRGPKFHNAMGSALQRMATGKNNSGFAKGSTAKWNDWVLGSVGNIMFLNGRSAALQLLSVGNYATATKSPGKFFANMFNPATFKKAKELFNSPYLRERRARAGFDVNAAEMQDMLANAKNMGDFTKKVLNFGFVATSFVDSVAIAYGGAAYMASNGGDTPANRESWIEQTEEAQQSSRPDRVSQWQTEGASKYILAFANTPQQYFRLVQKAGRRISEVAKDKNMNAKQKFDAIKGPLFRIAYYGAVQNMIFSSLQMASNALLGFGDEEDDDEEMNLLIGSASTMLRGMGMYGAIIDTAKNIIMEGVKQEKKSNPDHIATAMKAVSISPPISRKINQLRDIGKAYKYRQYEDTKEFRAIAKGAAFVTNLPTDWVVKYYDNINAIRSDKYEAWENVMLALGWSEYNFKDKDDYSLNLDDIDLDDIDLDDIDLDIDL